MTEPARTVDEKGGRPMKVGLLRAVGVATAVYGVAVAVVPDLLARPSGLVDAKGRTE